MRTGILTYLAVFLFVILFGSLVATLVWPFGGGGGLAGTLTFLGLGFLIGPFYAILAFGVAVFAFGVLLNARGTAHVREHVTDMLPGAIVVFSIVALISALR